MSTSQVLDPYPSISKQEYYSSLPRWRRWLAMLNWRPVVDFELREIEFNRREIEYKQRMQQLQIEEQQRQIAHEQRMKQLDELNSKLDALLSSSSTSSIPPRNIANNSED